VAWALGVNEGHEEERLFPWFGEGVVVAVPQPLLRDPQRGGIVGVSLWRAREQATRKLVEYDD
jgi:hypothetical protein